YWNKGLKRGKSPSQKRWAEEHFGDIAALENEFRRLAHPRAADSAATADPDGGATTPLGKTSPPSRVPVAAAGAEPGVDPTPTTIAHGTVRMEDHPDFPALKQELEELGYSLVPVEDKSDPPHVAVRHIFDSSGNRIRIEREVRIHPGMRFLDLEHERDHVYQMRDRFRNGEDLPTEVLKEDGKGKLTAANFVPRMKKWQDAIIEYHVRLQEYIRLAERGVDQEILDKHLQGVKAHRSNYWRTGLKEGRSKTQTRWARQHLPDIAELERRVHQVSEAPPQGGQ